jgi:hypothetical protein
VVDPTAFLIDISVLKFLTTPNRVVFLCPKLNNMTLNTTNPHCFTYQTDELLIELLGGISVEGLDRMRVTIKVTVVTENTLAT